MVTLRLRAVLVIASLLCLLIPASADALTTISQGYASSDKVSLGSIVSLKKNSTDQVNAANNANIDSILGVVINDGTSLLSLSTGESQQIQVATSGVVQVLVSDINGQISQGDQITASPVSGVGMKATSSIKVVGIAQGGLDESNNTSKQSYKSKDGVEHSIVLGQVPVLVNVSYFYKQPDKTVIPSAIQNVANALAGKAVKPLPIIISMAIFCVAIIMVISIVFTMIRSSIISIGRNPMSQSAVYRNLIQISALVLAILAVTVAAIYMILTKF